MAKEDPTFPVRGCQGGMMNLATLGMRLKMNFTTLRGASGLREILPRTGGCCCARTAQAEDGSIASLLG